MPWLPSLDALNARRAPLISASRPDRRLMTPRGFTPDPETIKDFATARAAELQDAYDEADTRNLYREFAPAVEAEADLYAEGGPMSRLMARRGRAAGIEEEEKYFGTGRMREGQAWEKEQEAQRQHPRTLEMWGQRSYPALFGHMTKQATEADKLGEKRFETIAKYGDPTATKPEAPGILGFLNKLFAKGTEMTRSPDQKAAAEQQQRQQQVGQQMLEQQSHQAALQQTGAQSMQDMTPEEAVAYINQRKPHLTPARKMQALKEYLEIDTPEEEAEIMKLLQPRY